MRKSSVYSWSESALKLFSFYSSVGLGRTWTIGKIVGWKTISLYSCVALRRTACGKHSQRRTKTLAFATMMLRLQSDDHRRHRQRKHEKHCRSDKLYSNGLKTRHRIHSSFIVHWTVRMAAITIKRIITSRRNSDNFKKALGWSSQIFMRSGNSNTRKIISTNEFWM